MRWRYVDDGLTVLSFVESLLELLQPSAEGIQLLLLVKDNLVQFLDRLILKCKFRFDFDQSLVLGHALILQTRSLQGPS